MPPRLPTGPQESGWFKEQLIGVLVSVPRTHGLRGAALRAVRPPYIISGTPPSPALNRPPAPGSHSVSPSRLGLSLGATFPLSVHITARVRGQGPLLPWLSHTPSHG